MTHSRRAFLGTSVAAAGLPLADLASKVTTMPTGDDPLGVRGDFAGANARTYLNTAYQALLPRQVAEAGRAFIERKATNPLLVGEMMRKTDEVRGQFARLIGAAPEEVGFLFSTSEGENLVAQALDLQPGDNVVIDELHYESEFVLYRALEARRGITMRVVKHRDGAVTARDLEPHVDRRTKLVSVAWVSHQNGFRHDMRPIADLAHAHGALCYTDAIQAVGMFPVDVKASGVDLLCCGSYKWVLGGFGPAPLYVRRELLDRIRPDRSGWMQVARELPDFRFELHKTAKQYEYSTLPFCEVYMLGAGLSYIERVGVSRIEQHTVPLARQLQDGLLRQGYRLFTPPGNTSSIVTYFFTGEATAHRQAFERATIDVTVRDALKQVRVSTALFNTADDVTKFLDVTKGLR
ncbi:MAG: aminotransferase class V-fold PLP-dependent enzyme [Gemmatimonadetes bacterium]|nr:aminotransferase class V-fold PLP-dependent enzyme [Gemmatimonadota bacterium]